MQEGQVAAESGPEESRSEGQVNPQTRAAKMLAERLAPHFDTITHDVFPVNFSSTQAAAATMQALTGLAIAFGRGMDVADLDLVNGLRFMADVLQEEAEQEMRLKAAAMSDEQLDAVKLGKTKPRQSPVRIEF